MNSFVRRSGRWGMVIGVIAALSACGVDLNDGNERGPDLQPTREDNAALTAPRPGEGALLQASAGTEQLVPPSAPWTIESNRSAPILEHRVTPPKAPEHEWRQDARAVAIEGEEAPGTGGETFDRGDFINPVVNEAGNVSFTASYGHGAGIAVATPTANGPGGGVFFWNRETDRLAPVAITGQQTDAGELPRSRPDYQDVMINDRNQIAFHVFDILQPSVASPGETAAPPRQSALFQAQPEDGRCDRFDLDVIAKTGDSAPGGGRFLDFFDLAENESGDIAFVATYVTPLTVTDAPTAAPAPFATGVFLYKADCRQIVPILRGDDPVPGTGGATLCENEGDVVRQVWMNDARVITFQIECLEPEAGVRQTLDSNPLDGSIWIRRPGEEVQLFLAIGSPGPDLSPCDSCSYDDPQPGGRITFIIAGRPGLSENAAAYFVNAEDGLTTRTSLVTKKLKEDAEGPLDVCAFDQEEIGNGYSINFGAAPTFSSDGIAGFDGFLHGWEGNTETGASAIFDCYQRRVHLLARSGGEKPVGKDNEFGRELQMESNSDRYSTFVDQREAPTGVFVVNTNPQLP